MDHLPIKLSEAKLSEGKLYISHDEAKAILNDLTRAVEETADHNVQCMLMVNYLEKIEKNAYREGIFRFSVLPPNVKINCEPADSHESKESNEELDIDESLCGGHIRRAIRVFKSIFGRNNED